MSETAWTQFIRGKRERRGLSLGKAAALIGVSKSHLWEMEMGSSRNPTISLLANMAVAYKVPVGRLATLAAAQSLSGRDA